MPDHITKQVRDGIKAACDLIPAVTDRVYVSRFWKFDREELPAINIYTDSEAINSEVTRAQQPHVQRREIRNNVMIIVKASDEAEDALDAIKLSVENEILSNPTFNGKAVETHLETVTTGLYAQADDIGVMQMTFVTLARTREAKPDIPLGG